MGRATFDFDGDTAVVTGGSSGIGRATALLLGEAGCNVVVADVRQDPIDEDADRPTHEVIAASGGTARFAETDVTEPTELAAAVDRAAEYGGLTVMVNNVGGHTPASVLETTPEGFERIWSLNVLGMLTGCQLAAERFIERDVPGAIVNTASIRSEFASADQVQYNASKGAVRMLTRTAAFEWAEHGIRVNAVAPGPIATDGRSRSGAAELRERIRNDEYTKPIPLGRAGEPAEVADAIAFLASDLASNVTGELLFVDGGYQIY